MDRVEHLYDFLLAIFQVLVEPLLVRPTGHRPSWIPLSRSEGLKGSERARRVLTAKHAVNNTRTLMLEVSSHSRELCVHVHALHHTRQHLFALSR